MMVKKSSISTYIPRIYKALLERFGAQQWWPADTPFEVIVGAVLTQNTNWGNVDKALTNLKREGLLSLDAIRDIRIERLASLIKPAGYFNVKAKRLKNVVVFIAERYGSLERMREETVEDLRAELLSVNGIGPETADAILLYALNKPIFVVDAYTKRFLRRHNMIGSDADYGQMQNVFHNALGRDEKMFNEYHALIVRLGKDYCRTVPLCEECPLKRIRYSHQARCSSCYRSFLKTEHRYLSGNKDRPVCSMCLALKD